MTSSRRTIWFCATGRTGFGHLRRCAIIAGAVRQLAAELSIGLVTNAAPLALGTIDRTTFTETEVRERADMAPWLGCQSEGPVVVDTAVLPGLADLQRPLALVLRETPQERVAQFRLSSERPWDLVLVPNPAEHWLPEVDQDFAQRIVPVGWVYREPPSPRRPPRESRRVLVATGGGGTAETAAALKAEIDAVLSRARAIASRPFSVVQAIAPRAASAGQLDQADETVEPGGALDREFASADIVISTAGYNSVLELALTTAPTLLVPIPRSIDDQWARARLWGPRLGACHDPADREASAAWLARCIDEATSRDPWDLGPSGGAAAARHILGLAT